MSKAWNGTVQLWDAQPQGLGGWTLNVHHVYDVTGRMLRFGNGKNRTQADLPPVIQTVAGNGESHASNGDGGPAVLASVTSPQAIAVGADGSLYIADAQSCIRKVAPDGIISTFAGQCFNAGFSGDGGPATSAQLRGPEDIALGPDESLYIADTLNQRIRRVDSSGIIQTVAGSGTTGFSGDGGPALQAKLSRPWGVDVASDGALYIADRGNGRIRSVSPDGIIRTVVAGTGNVSAPSNGNDGAALAATLRLPAKVRVGNDGSFYIVAASAVRRVGTDGIIRAFAGGDLSGYAGAGEPATNGRLFVPADIALARDGSVYIVDQNQTIRKVVPEGTMSTIVGIPGEAAFSGDNGPAARATIGTSKGIRVGPDGSLYVACSNDNRIRRVSPALAGLSLGTSAFRFSSEDGLQIYVFDGNGRHVRTLHALTGAVLYQFSYDGSGKLTQVVDVDGNVTQVSRDEIGNLTSMVGPFAQATSFTLDANGYLASSTDPAGQTIQFTYDAKGLMQTKTDARGGLSQYAYDSLGRLSADQDPAGGSKSLALTGLPTDFSVTKYTPLGRQKTYGTSVSSTGTFRRLNTMGPLQSSLAYGINGVTTTTTPDGTITTEADKPDPRFGMLFPVRSVTRTTPSGLTSILTTTRTATLSGANLATQTEEMSLNGATWTTVFDRSALTHTTTSPAGRQSTMTIDSAGRPTQMALPSTAPYNFAYDSHGRLVTTTQGARTWSQAYDAQGYLGSVTDPLGHVVSYTNDGIGRPTQTTLADARVFGATYDASDNTTTLALASAQSHAFSYTPVSLLASYTPPSVSITSPATLYSHDLDRNLGSVTRPDGVVVTYGYDWAGRLETTTDPQGTATRTYDSTTGKLSSVTSPSGEVLQYGHDGFLKTSVTWSGPIAGGISFGFDNNFRVTSQTINGTSLSLGYDPDGLLTQAGAITLIRDAANGRVTGTTLGSITDNYVYDTNGLFASYAAQYAGSTLYSETVVRDALGRITQKTEVTGGTTHVWGYRFDRTDRLIDVSVDGPRIAHYNYDANNNRTAAYKIAPGTSLPTFATYDAQDRLLTYGPTSYAYTDNGEVLSKTDGSGTTSYTYDALGNLIHVGLPSGDAIDYLVDGENRRVGKQVNGTLTEGWLYQDALHTVAKLDPSGNVVARFVFGSKPNVPDYYTTSTGTFRVLSDHLGSPRAIVNTSSGAIVEQIDYDAFGNVTEDTSPGLTPLGFAGGLYDQDTKLVRFGARDYDALVGRWTSKDPVRFRGGSNLYDYAGADPVNRIDLTGTIPVDQLFGLWANDYIKRHQERNQYNRCPQHVPSEDVCSLDGRTWTHDWWDDKWRGSDGSECLYDDAGNFRPDGETFNFTPRPWTLGHIIDDVLPEVLGAHYHPPGQSRVVP